MSKPNIHVSIAILMYQSQVLVGWREAKQHQGNKYEFPGGKVEVSETPLDACRRETLEEVGVEIKCCHPFDFIQHEYEDIIVNLHFFSAAVDDHQLQDIQSSWAWYTRQQLLELNFPSANKNMIERLYWQSMIKISDSIADLEVLEQDQLLYWSIDATEQNQKILESMQPDQLQKIILNKDVYSALLAKQQHSIKTIAIPQQQLADIKPADLIVGQRYIAVCGRKDDLVHAAKIGCDAVILHYFDEDGILVNYSALQDLAQEIHIPIFVSGHFSSTDLAQIKQHGAYGIALDHC